MSRVVYIEPYPKSLAKELHSDAIAIASDGKPHGHRIPFEPFMGVGPRRFFDLFSMKLSSGYAIDRKPNGFMLEWDLRRDSKPRVPMTPTSYIEREELIHSTLSSVFTIDEQPKQDSHEIRGLEGEARQGILDARGADSSSSRKMARMEEGGTSSKIAGGEQDK